MKVIRLTKDLTFPAGTTFKSCDGLTRRFIEGNYELFVATGKDSTLSVYVNEDVVLDRPDQFELVEM